MNKQCGRWSSYPLLICALWFLCEAATPAMSLNTADGTGGSFGITGLENSFEVLLQPLQAQGKPQLEFDLLEPVPVELCLRNRTLQERSVPILGHFNSARISLQNAQGDEVPLTLYGQRLMTRPSLKPFNYALTEGVKLKAGAEDKQLLIINRLFDLSEPGDYQLTIAYRAPLYFGQRKNAPAGLLPIPEKSDFSIRNFWKDAPYEEWKPQKQRPKPGDETILIPAPDDFPVPELVSNTLTFTIRPTGPSWYKSGDDYRRYK